MTEKKVQYYDPPFKVPAPTPTRRKFEKNLLTGWGGRHSGVGSVWWGKWGLTVGDLQKGKKGGGGAIRQGRARRSKNTSKKAGGSSGKRTAEKKQSCSIFSDRASRDNDWGRACERLIQRKKRKNQPLEPAPPKDLQACEKKNKKKKTQKKKKKSFTLSMMFSMPCCGNFMSVREPSYSSAFSFNPVSHRGCHFWRKA